MRLAVITSGGDAPGLNAVIRGAAATGESRGHEILGVPYGFEGLLGNGPLRALRSGDLEGIEGSGGTILGAAARGRPLADQGAARIRARMDTEGIDGLIIA